jgi:hypothetical protein
MTVSLQRRSPGVTVSLRRGLPAVLLACIACFAFDLVSVAVAPDSGRALAVAVSAVATILIPLFWLLSAFVIDRLARPMGGHDAALEFRDGSATIYLVLVAYSAFGALETVVNRWLPSASSVLDVVITTLAFAAIGFFIVLTARLVHHVYRVPALNAVALTFFPFAVLSAVLMAAILMISILHGFGVI